MKKLLLAIIFIFFPITTTLAVKVASLYQAEVPVSSQSPESRAEAVKEGFQQVLVKVTGDPEVIKDPAIQESLQKSDYYVQEFSYSSSTTSSSQYYLKIKYDPEDINRLLKRASINYWGENRPLILVWLAVTGSQQEIDIISNEDPGDILSAMKQEGKKYGIPLIFPVMDMADVSKVSAEEISNMSISTLKEAGKRYTPDAFLIGKIEPTSDGYESQWQLVMGKRQWNWTITDKSTEVVIEKLLNQISQTLSNHFVVKQPNMSQSWLKLKVTNVIERNSLAQLIKYLNQLAPVQEVRLAQVSGNIVDLAILVNGPVASFLHNATVGQRLTLTSKDEGTNQLVYEWVH